MTGPHYLQQPWRLRLYWFSEIQFCFLACGWFLVTAEGEEKSLEECVCVCVCVWLTAVNHMSVRWESSFREASHRWKARRRRPSIPPLSLSLIHCLSLSPCLVRAPTDFLFSVYSPQTHVNNSCYRADPRLQTLPSWDSDVLLLIVCHFPDLLLSYHSNAINSFVATPGTENEFRAECNIQCKHAPMHVPVYLQPCLSKQSEIRSAL